MHYGRSASGVYWRRFFFICRDFISVNKMIDLLQVDLSYVLKIERSELQCMRSRSERTKKSRGITNQEKY